MSADFLIMDIETMGTSPTAIVLNASFICGNWKDFDPRKKGVGVTYRFSPAEQKKMMRTMDDGTVKFWKNHPDAFEAVKTSGVPTKLEDFHPNVTRYLIDNDYDAKETVVWIRAPHFDQPILEDLFSDIANGIDLKCPWSHWAIRDVRTLVDLAWSVNRGYPPEIESIKKELNILKHDSLDDCRLDLALIGMALGEVSLDKEKDDDFPF